MRRERLRNGVKSMIVMLVLIGVALGYAFLMSYLEAMGEQKIRDDALRHLPYSVVVYDRSNKAIINYGAVCEVRDGVLYLHDATEISREDVSHLVE